ncbi:MAG: hypothetical protein R3277_09145 [Brumimicrobium sp.]|nr:hypothetical protein [Brumimicrobium sp.]
MKVVLTSSLLVFLFSCNFNESKVVCSVGEEELTEDHLEELILLAEGKPDNEEDRQNAIDRWIERQLITFESEKMIPEQLEKNKLKSQIELADRNLFDLENKFIRSNLDSVVTDEEILEYYERNRENYQSQSYIVKALYFKLPDSVGNHARIGEVFLLRSEKDKEEIKNYANLYATNFYFEESKWIFFEDLVRDIPIGDDKKKELILGRGEAVFKEGGYTHFINILDYRLKNISSPMEVEKDLIVKHILKRRVNKLRDTAKESILKDAKEKYEVTYP